MLGLAAILPAHAANGANPVSLGVTLENQEQRQLAGLVADVERLRLLRGRGGELMRAALCRCITGLWCCAAAVHQCLLARNMYASVQESACCFRAAHVCPVRAQDLLLELVL